MPNAHRKVKRRRGTEEHEPRTNPLLYCVRLGFFAGLIWGTLRWFLYTLHFTKVIPGFLADPFFRIAFLKTGWGHVVGVGSFIVFSIIAALVYYVILGRIAGPWPGLIYGALWWCFWFAAFGPVLAMMEPAYKIGYNTLATEFSIFLLWGLFIGYSIAYEFTDEASREPALSFNRMRG
jgi:hypothetical protein